MNRLNSFLLLLIPLGLAFGYWLLQNYQTPATEDFPTRRELLRRDRGQKPLFVYGATQPETAAKYKQMLTEIDQSVPWYDFEIRASNEVKDEDLKGKRLYLIGTIQSNPWLKKLQGKLPFLVQEGQFSLAEDVFNQAEDVLTFLYPNPNDAKQPLFVITGNSDAAILAHKSIEVRGDYQAFHKGKAQVFGLFSQELGKRWQFDPHLRRNLAFAEKPNYETTHFQFFTTRANGEHPPFELEPLAQRQEAIYQTLEAFLARNQTIVKPHPKIKYHLYPSMEDLGLAVGDINCTTQGFVRPTRRRREAQVTPNLTYQFFGVEEDFNYCNNGINILKELLRHQFGSPKIEALETGLATTFSQQWHEKGYAYWAARIYEAGYMPSLKSVFTNEWQQAASDVFSIAITGISTSFLVSHYGEAKFLSQYLQWQPNEKELDVLEPAFNTFLAHTLAQYQTEIATQRLENGKTKLHGFLKGFNFAHEGYQIYNGYLSQQAVESLEALKNLNSNAIAVIPYSFMPDPKKPYTFPFVHGADEESDESVVFVAKHAKDLGMTVMLKPQIWIRGSWPGEVEMQSAAEWDRFFQDYEHWISHYALLAEMYQIPILCVATEFGKATKGHEDRWIALFDRLRKLYSGQMTVAANWDGGFDHPTFWNHLDFITINHYKTLSNVSSATDAELRKGAQESVAFYRALYDKFKKPIYFGEVGFTATDAPWVKPWEYADGKKINLNDQKRAYEALLSALKGESWLGGYFWWKWPSFLDYGGPSDNDYTPNGKPAEAVIRSFFEMQ